MIGVVDLLDLTETLVEIVIAIVTLAEIAIGTLAEVTETGTVTGTLVEVIGTSVGETETLVETVTVTLVDDVTWTVVLAAAWMVMIDEDLTVDHLVLMKVDRGAVDPGTGV